MNEKMMEMVITLGLKEGLRQGIPEVAEYLHEEAKRLIKAEDPEIMAKLGRRIKCSEK